jgi:EAL domain-containing protein (putative c-di-GMP-specific phosphodiesterase class I)
MTGIFMEDNNFILIIDDDVDFANFLYDVAKTLNLNCKVTTNSNDFMNAYHSSVTLIFMDLNIPNIDGIELLRFVETKKFETDIILMSGVDKRILDSAKEFAISKGLSVVSSFQKPIRLAELEDILKKFTCPKSPKIEKKPIIKHAEFKVTKEEITQAIQRDDFVVFYQPKIEIATDKLIGVEALIRWKHPLHGLIFPDQFISIVESFGLIEEITWLNIIRAIKEMSTIKRKIGFSFMLSLNLSPYALHDLTFPDKFLNLINQFSINPEDIIFEITETGLLKELSSVLDIFTRLRLKNIQLSIDDFGTGYAMMQQLKLIPATEIKIDKSFVQNMFELDSARVTVKKIIEMGHELGMKVTAEGVETREQLQALRELQCDIAQGYYYSSPIPITTLIDWINHR